MRGNLSHKLYFVRHIFTQIGGEGRGGGIKSIDFLVFLFTVIISIMRHTFACMATE